MHGKQLGGAPFGREYYREELWMDNIDLDILKCLRENSRLGASVIGERVKLSVSAVIDRIRKLERSGIIRQYTVVLDAKKIRKGVSSYILVSLEHPKYNEHFIDFVRNDGRITENFYIAGNFDFIVKVMTDTTEAMADTLNEIKSVEGVSRTVTLLVLSNLKEVPPALPETGDGEGAAAGVAKKGKPRRLTPER